MSTLNTFSTSVGRYDHGTLPAQRLHVLYTYSDSFNKTCATSVGPQSCYRVLSSQP